MDERGHTVWHFAKNGNSEETKMIQEVASFHIKLTTQTTTAFTINLKSTSQNCCLKFSSKHCWKNCWSRNFTGNKTLPTAIKESPYFHCRVVLTCNFSYYWSITKSFLLLIHSISQDYNGFNWLQLIVQRNYNSIPTHEGIPCTLESSWPALLPSE